MDIIASLPSYEADQTDRRAGCRAGRCVRQRGRKVFERSVQGLRMLNQYGYGSGGGRLDLVFNPPGPFLPPKQDLPLGEQISMGQEMMLASRSALKVMACLSQAPVPTL